MRDDERTWVHPIDERFARWKSGEPMNGPDRIGTIVVANVARPGGGEDHYLREEDISRFRDDPDAFAAELYGLTKAQYREWVALDGAALCGGTSKSGKPCRNSAAAGLISQLDAHSWLKWHRNGYCRSHNDGDHHHAP
jgi:hypothetical protein